MTTEERFWSKVNRTAGCWEWTGARTAPGWHGVFAVNGSRQKRQMVMAHRFSWEIAYGPVPAGLRVLHACDNPACVRPTHLMVGSQRANMADASRKGRMRRKVATHCKRGHAFEGNTDIHPTTGRRMCATCRRWRQERWTAQRRVARIVARRLILNGSAPKVSFADARPRRAVDGRPEHGLAGRGRESPRNTVAPIVARAADLYPCRSVR